MYAINRLSSHDSYPKEKSFQGIKHLIHCLAGLPHCTTVYPYFLDKTTTHDVFQEV